MDCSSVESTKTTMKTVKIIDGKAMLCESIEANFQGEVKTIPVSFYASSLVRAVERRMEECMSKLTKAITDNEIIEIMPVEIGGQIAQNIMFTDGTSFVTASYEAMESLLGKLKEIASDRFVEKITVDRLEGILTAQEADQLFKCYSAAGHKWSPRLAALDILRDVLRTTEFNKLHA